MTGALLARAVKRLRSIYSSQKSRAKKFGDVVPYTADELVSYLLARWADGCPYCGCRLTPKGFQVDHILPLARGGSWDITNTQVICTRCNRRKGSLTHMEFIALLSFVRTLDEQAATNILARLSAGGAWLATKF